VTRREGFNKYANRLEEAARAHASLGYFDRYVHQRIDFGFVGPVPKDVRDLIRQAPEGSDLRVARSLFTVRQLDRAQDKAIANREFQVGAVGLLDRGRGIEVVTESRELVHSHRPAWLLGVRVGVIVRAGTVSPT